MLNYWPLDSLYTDLEEKECLYNGEEEKEGGREGGGGVKGGEV